VFPRKELQQCCILKLNARGCEILNDEWGKGLKEFSAKNAQKYIMRQAESTAAGFELESKFVFNSTSKISTECHKEINSETFSTWLLSIFEVPSH
jgi:hypothetical protein